MLVVLLLAAIVSRYVEPSPGVGGRERFEGPELAEVALVLGGRVSTRYRR